jgi:hypothetical protein
VRAGKVTSARQEFAHDLAAGKDERLFEEPSPPLPSTISKLDAETIAPPTTGPIT